jgi:hypothetical protein
MFEKLLAADGPLRAPPLNGRYRLRQWLMFYRLSA